MNSIHTIYKDDFPPLLREIHNPPKHLSVCGVLPPHDHIFLTVVGSRRASTYGKEVTQKLIEGLKGLPVVIVSGLAYGIDAVAHTSALRAGLKTIAVPGSGLDKKVLYPKENMSLAEMIIEKGGALISAFPDDQVAAPWTFPQRNKIMAGISHATLVIEADIRSGTLITSKFAGEFNRNILAVPGSIFQSKSDGPHMLIRLGATPITCQNDLIEALGFKIDTLKEKDISQLSNDEQTVLETLSEPLSREALKEAVLMDATRLSITLSLLEIKGLIHERLGEIYRT